jgi:glycosyltransferase involved in cell wall biosynthesis
MTRSRLRLLWVKAGRLLPVDTGGKLRSYHLARALAGRHELTMLTYYDGPRDAAYERDIAHEFPGAVTIRYGLPTSGRLATALRYLTTIASPAPFAVTKFTTREVQKRIAEWARERRFDAMICDFLSASRNFAHPPAIPTILFQHNVESSLWERQATHAPNVLLRAAYGLEAAKMKRYERTAVETFRHIVAVSEHDRLSMTAMGKAGRIVVVPTGVDVGHFRDAASTEPTEPEVIFLGSMDWEPNIDGVEWMCREIWPRIRAAVPNAVFRIVGRSPNGRVTRLASDSVTVTGSVPSVEPWLARAMAFVVPLRIGGGTRLKIFEAMSAGRAIVSTTIGAEGLPVEHGKNILLADDAQAFADAVIRVLKESALRRRLAAAALALASEHDWSTVVQVLERAIRDACDDAAKSGAARGTG